jgi:hypothetical protein
MGLTKADEPLGNIRPHQGQAFGCGPLPEGIGQPAEVRNMSPRYPSIRLWKPRLAFQLRFESIQRDIRLRSL